MSFSWRDFLEKNKRKERTPSPTLNIVLCKEISRVYKLRKPFMKRISLPASCFLKRDIKGSMTVEATVLLPLVLFFFLQLMGAVEMMRLHGKLTFALWECGSQLSVYTAVPEEITEAVPDIAVSYLYVKNRVEDFLGEDYLDNSPLVKGSEGLNYLASDYEADCIDIGVTYQVQPPICLFSFPSMRMATRYYARAWTGYEIQEDLRYVYVTLYGEVWHARADCSYIHITVQETDKNKIHSLRNAAGKKYDACDFFKDKELGEMVYFTQQGDRYHRDKTCSALTRYVRAVLWQEELSYRPCSRCAGEGEGAK